MKYPDDLLEGIRAMHDDLARPDFLRTLWNDRETYFEWMESIPHVSLLFQPHALPMFMHGGSSRGRIVVMGINPGWHSDNALIEEPFKQTSADNYLSIHDDFFRTFAGFVSAGRKMSPWWSKLAAVIAGLQQRPAPVPGLRFRSLDGVCVANDVIPLHSRRDLIPSHVIQSHPVLTALAEATVEGLARSGARLVLVFSPQGYDLLVPRLQDSRHTTLLGGRGKRIEVTTGRFGDTPCLAVRNQILVQPLFPYDELLPQLRGELARFPEVLV